MARKRRFSTESFGTTVQTLMAETGTTYRALADKTGLSAGYLNHMVHGNRPVPAHFQEYRIRTITARLEKRPELVDRLYKRLEG